MRRKIRKRDADDRPSRRRRLLRTVVDRELDKELRYQGEALESEDDLRNPPQGEVAGNEADTA